MSSPPDSTAHIAHLASLISSSVQTLQKVCAADGLAFPSLDDAFAPPSEAFRSTPEGAEAARVIAGAALQLVAAVMSPPEAIYALVVSGVYTSAGLRACLEANVVEILREAGPGGLHTDDIAAKCNIPSQKLGRMLRFLATYHVFKEVAPDVFTNTRLSSVLDTRKPVSDLFANPDTKHENTSGFPALVCHHLDEAAKSSTLLWETFSSPSPFPSSNEPDTPFGRAFNTPDSVWSFLSRDEEARRHKRFESAMVGILALEPVDAIVNAYDWKSLPDDSVVVDVGSGVGSSTLKLAEVFPNLKFVAQDQPLVIEAAKNVWDTKLPEAVKSGRVTLQAHNFMTPQPVTNASVFILKQILHDWTDGPATQILTHLRAAAKPGYTKLVIVDNIPRYACAIDPERDLLGQGLDEVPQGAIPHEAPEPLLANYGVGGGVTSYAADIIMMVLFDAQERPVKHVANLLQKTGWKLVKVQEGNGFLQPMEAVAV